MENSRCTTSSECLPKTCCAYPNFRKTWDLGRRSTRAFVLAGPVTGESSVMFIYFEDVSDAPFSESLSVGWCDVWYRCVGYGLVSYLFWYLWLSLCFVISIICMILLFDTFLFIFVFLCQRMICSSVSQQQKSILSFN